MIPTKKERKALADYLYELKTAMWLARWRIDFYFDAEEDALAAIKPTYGQRHAELHLPPGQEFFTWEPHKQRSVLVHELLHCYAADVQELPLHLQTNLGDQAFEAWKPGWVLAVEHMVDDLTNLLAHQDSDWLPIPDLPKPSS